MNKALEHKAIEIVQEFLDGELGDYSHFKYKLDDAEVSGKEVRVNYNVTTSSSPDSYNGLYFNVIFKDEDNIEDEEEATVTLEIDLGEDNWQEIRSYDWQVKYFWMTLLSWEI